MSKNNHRAKTRDSPGGAPKGNRNAVKHGYYKQEEIYKRKEILELIRNINNLTRKFKE